MSRLKETLGRLYGDAVLQGTHEAHESLGNPSRP